MCVKYLNMNLVQTNYYLTLDYWYIDIYIEEKTKLYYIVFLIVQ